jgi:asparagine synthase (glutamine-hydrolysing)
MCGIAAFFEPGRRFDPDLLDGAERDLFHRGPDSGGQLAEAGFALVFRRLAILDPRSISDQPMSDPSGRFTIIFNGEIYNYKALREELAAAGVVLRTTGDTEAILQGYALWGEKVVDKLEGMFAFLIVDRRERCVVAARDPFGIKPLYVHRGGRLTAFASEMRPLTRLAGASPDPKALGELLTFRFAAGRLSNLRGIEKVPGGTLVRLSLDSGDYAERRFADPLATLEPDKPIDAGAASELALDALRRSVRAHLQSDVGYALQLSGGVDSSLVAALAFREVGGRIASFGISLPGLADDEARWQRAVVERYGLDHHDLALDGAAFADALPRAIAAMEGPTAHFGCVMLMLLCGKIRQHTKVVLTGEGADEFFGGYMRYGRWRELRRKKWLARVVPDVAWPFLQRWREIERYNGRIPEIYASMFHDFVAMDRIFPDLADASGARDCAAGRFGDFRARMFAVDQTGYLESLLMRQDKMAMAMSVEARVPYTHWPLAQVINRIPVEQRAPGGTTKPLLKTIAEAFLPRDLIHRRKNGLRLPLRDWLLDRKGLGRYLECLTDPDCRLAAYGDGAGIRRAVAAFLNGQRQMLPPLEHLVNVELWLRSVKVPA